MAALEIPLTAVVPLLCAQQRPVPPVKSAIQLRAPVLLRKSALRRLVLQVSLETNQIANANQI